MVLLVNYDLLNSHKFIPCGFVIFYCMRVLGLKS
jgi:hypothetical protein